MNPKPLDPDFQLFDMLLSLSDPQAQALNPILQQLREKLIDEARNEKS